MIRNCTLLGLFFLNAYASSIFGEGAIAIEISSGRAKITTFSISCNNEKLAETIKKNLAITKRFQHVKTENNLETAGVDVFIKLTLIENKIHVEIFDVLQKKLTRNFFVEGQNEDVINTISNEIYKTWLGEEGSFDSTILFASRVTKDLSVISQQDYTLEQSKIISSPISYLSNIICANNRIYITRFCPRRRGFSIFSYKKSTKQFSRILSIHSESVFAPAIYNGTLYVSAAYQGTTGIYAIDNQGKDFSDFKKFESQARLITKLPKKIATSINIFNDTVIFCCNYHGIPGIFIKQKQTNALKQISSSQAAYYDPTMFEDQKIAAIKTQNQLFHLVVIDLKTLAEKTLLSKYYISKPAWSPCGNWVAVSCKNRGEKERVIIIHKDGKYIRDLSEGANPIWVLKNVI